ncbi:hypothetical protein [Nocardia sp. CDC160]|uniref:hypothetical protein n=1 Tax=Nocardia sp. CDC160 TaxID=3112166 RepID=UPI002DBA4286|nr:hypothetical protein [Nocardia sp. CDC160]MEC3918093.1 hypothetical protein [Nocardia sp. CDC160]
MIRLRLRRRSLAIAGATCLAAAALVAVTMPAAEAEAGPIYVYGDYLKHENPTICAATLSNSHTERLVA